MRILQIAPQVPFPLSDGGKVGIFNITKYLARRGHEITLLAADVHRPVHVEPLLEHCDLIRVAHSNKNTVPGAFRNLFSDTPYNIGKYQSSELEQRMRHLLSRRTFDIVHVDHLHMASYGLLCREIAGIPVVLREHNVESVIMERYLAVTRNPILRSWLRMQLRRLRAYEREVASAVDACCMMTREDEAVLKQLSSEARTAVIPAGVEKTLFDKRKRRPIPGSLALVGDYSWGPNSDSLSWFLSAIFPRILEKRPDATLFLIGKNVPAGIDRMAGRNIVVRGLVPDFKEELRRYEMLVVPLRVGGGMRLKIVESFAMGVPVVATSVGGEGIGGKHGQHMLLADTEMEFAESVALLIGNRKLSAELTRNAHTFVARRFRWESIARAFEDVYRDVRPAGHRRAKKGRIR